MTDRRADAGCCSPPELVYRGEGALPLDAGLINSGGREGRGGGRLQGQRACTCFPEGRMPSVAPVQCGFPFSWRPPASCNFPRNQACGFNRLPQISGMNLASPGDSFLLGWFQRECDCKSEPISVHLDVEREAPQSKLGSF